MTPERRVLIYSQRGLSRHVSRCPGYEFEDLVAAELETADILAPTASRSSPRPTCPATAPASTCSIPSTM